MTNSFQNASAFNAQSTSFFGAAAAEAQAELDAYFASAEEKNKDNDALLDVVQFLAIGGVAYFSVARDAVAYTLGTSNPGKLEVGTIFDAYTLEAWKYAKELDRTLIKVANGNPINTTLEYKKLYSKRRAQIQIMGDAYTDADTQKLTYPIATRFVDVLTGVADDWQSMDQAGGVWGQKSMHLDTAIDGTQVFYLVRKSGNVAVNLGHVDLMDRFVNQVHESTGLIDYINLLNGSADAKRNIIRFSHRAQLVFLTVFKAMQDKYRADAAVSTEAENLIEA